MKNHSVNFLSCAAACCDSSCNRTFSARNSCTSSSSAAFSLVSCAKIYILVVYKKLYIFQTLFISPIQHYVIKFVRLVAARRFSLGTSVSSTNKTDIHNITEIVLKVALNTIALTLTISIINMELWLLNQPGLFIQQQK